MKTKLRTVTILIGFLVIWVPQAASAAVPTELEDLQRSLDNHSVRDSYADSCPAGNVGAREFERFTLIISYGSHRIIYTDRDYLGPYARHGGCELIIKIDGDGLLEV